MYSAGNLALGVSPETGQHHTAGTLTPGWSASVGTASTVPGRGQPHVLGEAVAFVAAPAASPPTWRPPARAVEFPWPRWSTPRPRCSNGVVFFADTDGTHLLRCNAKNGALRCSFATASSPRPPRGRGGPRRAAADHLPGHLTAAAHQAPNTPSTVPATPTAACTQTGRSTGGRSTRRQWSPRPTARTRTAFRCWSSASGNIDNLLRAERGHRREDVDLLGPARPTRSNDVGTFPTFPAGGERLRRRCRLRHRQGQGHLRLRPDHRRLISQHPL